MKIIDLLNKIANGEEVPKKIKFDGDIYEYFEDIKYKDYRYKEEKTNIYGYLTSRIEFNGFGILTDEVEILDDNKKIEKLDIIQEKNCKNNWKWKLNGYNISTPQKIMGDKINEIIEVINEK